MTPGLPLRLKYVCGRYGRPLIAVLLVVSTVAFAGAAVGATESREPERLTVQTDNQRIDTTLTAFGTVSGNSTLYERGAEVVDAPVYLLSATPNLTVRVLTTVPADRDVTVTQRVGLVLSATRNGDVFWSEERTLVADTLVVADGTARSTVTLDVATLARDRLAAVRAETADIGLVRAHVVTNVSYDTGTYTGHTNLSSPLVVSERAYGFDTPRAVERNHSTPVTRLVDAPGVGNTVSLAGVGVSIPDRSLLWTVVGTGALGAALFVGSVGRRIGDFESFAKHYETVRYADWISRGRMPTAGRHARVPVETLLDLVDIAIDSEKRVIHDEAQGVYAVLDDGLVYEFRDDADAPGHMYEFGLAPVSETLLSPDQAHHEADPRPSNADDSGPDDA